MVKRRSRFPSFFDDDSDPFADMEQFHKLVDDMMKRSFGPMGGQGGKLQSGQPLVYGFSMRVGPDGKPHMEHFGNVRQGKVTDEREPLVDVVDAETEVRVVAELPGVDKKDIHMDAENGVLHLHVKDPDRSFAKDVRLPIGTDEQSAKATCKNGILEVVFRKKTSKEKGGIRVI